MVENRFFLDLDVVPLRLRAANVLDVPTDEAGMSGGIGSEASAWKGPASPMGAGWESRQACWPFGRGLFSELSVCRMSFKLAVFALDGLGGGAT